MQNRRLFPLAMIAALALSLATPGLAWADDESAPEPKKKRIRISLPKASPEPLPLQFRQAEKSPMDAVMRWAMGEMHSHMAKAGQGSDAQAMLKSWFEGGADVPMAGLRDSLKADGWNADSLSRWMHRHMHRALSEAPDMLRRLQPEMGGPNVWVAPPQVHRYRMQMPWGEWHGQPRRGWQQGRRQGPRWQRRQHGHGHGRWGQGPRRGWRRGMGHGMGGPRGMGGSAGPMTSRAIILWNDGSGWQQRELPMGRMGMGMFGPHGMHGSQGMGPMGMPGPHGMGQHGMGPMGMGGMHRGPAIPHGLPAPKPGHKQTVKGLEQVLKQLEGLKEGASLEELESALKMLRKQMSSLEGLPQAQPKPAPNAQGMPDMKSIEKLLQQLGIDARGMGDTPSRKVKIRITGPDGSVKELEGKDAEAILEDD